MSSQLESDLHSRFAHLLQPIRDLTKNWDVDVASQLEEYIDEIAQITISFDGGTTQMNFAEAALLIQGSTCVYSRKVEYLYVLVYQTLDLVASKRNQKHAWLMNQDIDPDISFAQRVDDNQFLTLDDIPVATNIDMSEQSVVKSVSIVPRTPSSLIPLMDYEKTHSTPLYSREGELIGDKMDFKMNTSIIHKSGALLLEPIDHMVIEVSLNNGRSLTIDKHTPREKLNAFLPPGQFSSPQLNGTVPLADQCQADCVEMDNTFDYAGGGLVDSLSPPQVVPELRPRGGGRVKIASEPNINDPWTLLDPHDPGDKSRIKPFKKGITYRVPPSLSNTTTNRKRKQFPVTPLEPLAEFIRRSFYSCSSLFPKNQLKAPLSSEFEGHYWVEQKRRLQQKKKENLTMRRLGRDSAVTLQEQVRTEDLGNEDSLDGYQPLGDPASGNHYGDELGAEFEEAFEGYNHSHVDIRNDPFQGVEPMDKFRSDCHGSQQEINSYEDLVRNYVESTMASVIAYCHETDLSKRVREWEARVKPWLQTEEQRSVFDIHQYGANIINEFTRKENKRGNCNQLYFHEIGADKNASEICRLLAATLQLANDGNVLIETCGQEVDSMKVTLLNTELAHKTVSQYTAPSVKIRQQN